MQWEASTIWFSREKYEIRMIRPDLWILYSPDGMVDTDTKLDLVKELAEAHLKKNPIVPI